MSTLFVLQNVTTVSNATGNSVDIASNSGVVVAANVSIVNQTASGCGVNIAGYGSADIEGSVYGPYALHIAGHIGSSTEVRIGATGLLDSTGLNALVIGDGNYQVANAGQIIGSADGVDLDLESIGGVSAGFGGGIFTNTGLVEGSEFGNGVANFDTSSNTDTLINYGKILAGTGVIDAGPHLTILDNHGSINGSSGAISANGAETLTNSGDITGSISIGDNSSLANSGSIEGAIGLGATSQFKNSGSISGDVTLGTGDTFLDSGAIEGSVKDIAGSLSTGAHDVSIIAGGSIAATSGNALTLSSGNYTLENAGSLSAMRVTGKTISGVELTGAGSLVNSGSITGADNGVWSHQGSGKSQYLYNSGTISGSIGVDDSGGHTARVVNYGQIVSTNQSIAVYADIGTSERFVNEGGVTGDIDLNGPTSTVVDGGSIHGSVNFSLGSGRVVNSGSIDGNITYGGTGNVYLGKGGSFTGTLTGTGSDGRYYAGAGVEKFGFTTDGAAAAVGGTGETTFDYGSKFTNSMTVQGGSGTTIVDLEGNYTGNAGVGNSGAIFLGARTMVGVDKVVFGAGYSYSLSVSASTIANGATMTVDASAVGAGQTATLNISKDVGGFYDFIGGAGLNTIICAASNLFANDVFIGGSNASNAINFKTAGTVLSAAFANISGFSVINLVSGTNDIQLNDFMVTKANNHTVAVNLSTGADIIDSSLLITSSNNVVVNAQNASAGDTFIFGAAKETVTLGAGVSTSVNYDTVSNFNFGSGSVFDALTVTGYTPLGIDAAVSGSLSTASFDADLATALAGHLHSGDALLFTANAGTLAGDTFLIASTNGSAGYAAGDFVARLTGTTTGTLAVGNV